MTYSSYYLNNMKYNTDKPMELREKIADVVNQMLNRNNFEFETRVDDLEKIVSQAIQATREETVKILIELRQQAGLCIDAANSNLEKHRTADLFFQIEKFLDSLTNKSESK